MRAEQTRSSLECGDLDDLWLVSSLDPSLTVLKFKGCDDKLMDGVKRRVVTFVAAAALRKQLCTSLFTDIVEECRFDWGRKGVKARRKMRLAITVVKELFNLPVSL